MASKDNRGKTTKTARVMNLLSKKQDAPAAEETGEVSAAATPPIVSSLAPDAAVSVQIKNALEDALEGEPDASGPDAPQVQEEVPVEPEAPVEPVSESPAPAGVQEQQPTYVNVMQILVEEQAPKYIRLTGTCQCPRCVNDVKAITLNNLPSKYVVMEQGDMIPRLTIYEGRFSSDIIAQLMNACKIVSDTPHHSR